MRISFTALLLTSCLAHASGEEQPARYIIDPAFEKDRGKEPYVFLCGTRSPKPEPSAFERLMQYPHEWRWNRSSQ